MCVHLCRTDKCTYAMYTQACVTYTLHILNKTINNVHKIITDFILTYYNTVKEKSFLEIPVPLSLTMKTLSGSYPADMRHPDRLPASQPFTHLAGLGWP